MSSSYILYTTLFGLIYSYLMKSLKISKAYISFLG